MTRQNVYLDAGLITTDDLLDGVYQDSFDARCHHVLARGRDGEPVGYARLIVRDRATPLRLVGQVAVNAEADEPRSAEVSGFAVVEGHDNKEVLAGLGLALCELAQEYQITYLYAEVEPPFLKALQESGVPFEEVTPQKWIHNAWNFVIRVQFPEFVALVDEMAQAGQLSPFLQPFAFPSCGPVDTLAARSDVADIA